MHVFIRHTYFECAATCTYLSSTRILNHHGANPSTFALTCETTAADPIARSAVANAAASEMPSEMIFEAMVKLRHRHSLAHAMLPGTSVAIYSMA
jgi:hypothetical protein